MQMNYFCVLIFCGIALVSLSSCQDDEGEIITTPIADATDTITIGNESYVLNGSIIQDYNSNGAAAFAEMVSVSRTPIDSSVIIDVIYLIKDGNLYINGKPQKFDPTDNFTLVSNVEGNIPDWALDPNVHMTIEVEKDGEQYYLKDTQVPIE